MFADEDLAIKDKSSSFHAEDGLGKFADGDFRKEADSSSGIKVDKGFAIQGDEKQRKLHKLSFYKG